MLCLATVYSLTFGVFSVQYTIVWHGGGPGGAGGGTDCRVVLHGRCSVARWQKFRPKSSKVAEFWLNFTKKVAEKGPHKIFKRSSLLLAMITTTYNVHQDEIKFDF
jgi:hypothetical protein